MLLAISRLPKLLGKRVGLNKCEIKGRAPRTATISPVPSHRREGRMEDGRLHATSRSLGSVATAGMAPEDGFSLVIE